MPLRWAPEQFVACLAAVPGIVTYMEFDHDIISMVILPLLQIQEGQLSIADESMCTYTGLLNRRLSLPRRSMSCN